MGAYMSGKPKTSAVNVRFDDKTRAMLEKEAVEKGLDLSSYIRMLVFTHHDRKKKV